MDERNRQHVKGRTMNLFREAKQLLDKKDSGAQLTEEELRLINTAIIPLNLRTDGIFPEDITIAEGLEELAKMVEEGNEKMATKLKIICAWCGKDMGEKDGQGQTGVTSGMCADCWEKLFPGVPYPKEKSSGVAG